MLSIKAREAADIILKVFGMTQLKNYLLRTFADEFTQLYAQSMFI